MKPILDKSINRITMNEDLYKKNYKSRMKKLFN